MLPPRDRVIKGGICHGAEPPKGRLREDERTRSRSQAHFAGARPAAEQRRGAGTGAAAHTTSTADTCPQGWSCADIGAPTPAGSQALSGSTWTLSGGGWDIWGSADQFHYVWQSLNGDGNVSARVSAQSDTAASAKAGVMLRQSADAGAPYYLAALTPGNGLKIEYRATPGGSAVGAAYAAGSAPLYLKVARTGSTFTAYTSADGLSWSAVAGSSVSLNLSPTLLAGLAVSSMNRSTASSATFDAVQISSTAAGANAAATPTSAAVPVPPTNTPTLQEPATATPTSAAMAPTNTPTPPAPATATPTSAAVAPSSGHAIKTVFLIVLENHNWSSFKGSSSAPYINNTLLPMASHAEQYYNPPGNHPSLPNYLWLEAGTNFGIADDNPPSSHPLNTSSHLVSLLSNAGISWKAY